MRLGWILILVLNNGGLGFFFLFLVFLTTIAFLLLFVVVAFLNLSALLFESVDIVIDDIFLPL